MAKKYPKRAPNGRAKPRVRVGVYLDADVFDQLKSDTEPVSTMLNRLARVLAHKKTCPFCGRPDYDVHD